MLPAAPAAGAAAPVYGATAVEVGPEVTLETRVLLGEGLVYEALKVPLLYETGTADPVAVTAGWLTVPTAEGVAVAVTIALDEAVLASAQ